MAIKTYELSHEIMKRLETYTQDVIEEINKKGLAIVKKAVKELKATSPEDTGEYAQGWTFKTLKFYRAPWRFTIHNKDRYRIAHLLEKGFTQRNGKRKPPTKVHIQPVDEMVREEYLKVAEEAIKNAAK